MATKQSGEKKNKVFSVIATVVTALLFAVAVFIFVSAAVAKKQNRPVSFFGYSYSIVVSPSMEPEIRVGELIVIRSVEMSDVAQGDNVVFKSLDAAIYGRQVVHKAIEIHEDEQGVYFITKGTGNEIADSNPVRESNFIGVVVGHSVFWGKILGFLTKPVNLIFITVILIAVYVGAVQTVKIVKLAKNREEDSDGKAEE